MTEYITFDDNLKIPNCTFVQFKEVVNKILLKGKTIRIVSPKETITFDVTDQKDTNVYGINNLIINDISVPKSWVLKVNCFTKNDYNNFLSMKIPINGALPPHIPDWIVKKNNLIKTDDFYNFIPKSIPFKNHVLCTTDNYIADFGIYQRCYPLTLFHKITNRDIKLNIDIVNFFLFKMLELINIINSQNYIYTRLDLNNIMFAIDNNHIQLYLPSLHHFCMQNSEACKFDLIRTASQILIRNYQHKHRAEMLKQDPIKIVEDPQERMVNNVIYTCFNLINPKFFIDSCCNYEDIHKHNICEYNQWILNRQAQEKFYTKKEHGQLGLVLKSQSKNIQQLLTFFNDDNIHNMEQETINFFKMLLNPNTPLPKYQKPYADYRPQVCLKN